MNKFDSTSSFVSKLILFKNVKKKFNKIFDLLKLCLLLIEIFVIYLSFSFRIITKSLIIQNSLKIIEEYSTIISSILRAINKIEEILEFCTIF